MTTSEPDTVYSQYQDNYRGLNAGNPIFPQTTNYPHSYRAYGQTPPGTNSSGSQGSWRRTSRLGRQPNLERQPQANRSAEDVKFVARTSAARSLVNRNRELLVTIGHLNETNFFRHDDPVRAIWYFLVEWIRKNYPITISDPYAQYELPLYAEFETRIDIRTLKFYFDLQETLIGKIRPTSAANQNA